MRVGVGVAVAAVFLLGSCTSSQQASTSTPAETSSAAPTELTVMEFNIEYGGESVDFGSVIKAIDVSGADVVALEEAYGNTARIARRLGWRYFDPRMQLVSRLPLLAPGGSDGLFTYIELAPGEVAAIGNVHLPSAPYGPNRILAGAKPGEILKLEERVRVRALQPTLDALTALADKGVPTFLLGDFNAPSRLDYTAETVGTRKQIRFPLDWPVSRAVEEAGFVDGYRAIYPDPVEDPGITWPADRPFVKGYNPAASGKPADRIDLVYGAGPATATDAQILGEKGGDGVDVPVTPWPTDHRAPVVTYSVEPAAPPTMVAVEQRLVDPGGEIVVTFHGPGEQGERVALVPANEPGGAPAAERSTGANSPTDGRITFPTADLQPGAYEAVLMGGGGALARTSVWIRDPSAKAFVGTTKNRYAKGEPIEVEWRDAPGNRWDWIGIYKRGADPNVAWYIDWLYTGATVVGTATFDEEANGRWPLDPGKYTVYLLIDDSYQEVAGGDFTIGP